MKIYLIDDNRDGAQSGMGNLESYPLLSLLHHIERTSVPNDYLKDASCVFLHDSFVDSDSNGNFLTSYISRGKIITYINAHSIPYIIFSGGITEDSYEPAEDDLPERGPMKKANFYRRLKGFLDKCTKTDRIDLKGLVTDTCENHECSSSVNLNTIESITHTIFPDVNDTNAMESFVNNCRSLTGLLLDVDGKSSTAVKRVVLYIRLSLHDIGMAALMPIVFRTAESPEELLRRFAKDGNADILLCQGSFIQSGEDSVTSINAEMPSHLDAESYIHGFLNRVKVLPLAEIGNHTIANDWGAYVLAQYLPEQCRTEELKERMRKVRSKDAVFLKYLRVSKLKSNDIKALIDESQSQSAAEKKAVTIPDWGDYNQILFIDDQDEQWAPVMRSIFHNQNLTVIGRNTGNSKYGVITDDADYNYLDEKARETLKNSTEYDLIILDLRLGGAGEESKSTNNLSGMKLLKELTERNRGQQVIMFTSSNKTWNMQKALVDYHAAGYYIKEAPNQIVTPEESRRHIQNFINLIKKCLGNSYLIDMVEDCNKWENEIDTDDRWKDSQWLWQAFEPKCVKQDDLDGIVEQMKLAVRMHIHAAQTQDTKDYAYSFIALEQALEIIRKWNRAYGAENLNAPISSVFRDVTVYSENPAHYINIRNNFVHKKEQTNGINYCIEFQNLWDCIIYFLTCLKNQPEDKHYVFQNENYKGVIIKDETGKRKIKLDNDFYCLIDFKEDLRTIEDGDKVNFDLKRTANFNKDKSGKGLYNFYAVNLKVVDN